MTTLIEKEFKSLTLAERVNLVEDLWERVASEPQDLPVSTSQTKELERRRQLYQADPKRATPWAQGKAEILRNHAKRRRTA